MWSNAAIAGQLVAISKGEDGVQTEKHRRTLDMILNTISAYTAMRVLQSTQIDTTNLEKAYRESLESADDALFDSACDNIMHALVGLAVRLSNTAPDESSVILETPTTSASGDLDQAHPQGRVADDSGPSDSVTKAGKEGSFDPDCLF